MADCIGSSQHPPIVYTQVHVYHCKTFHLNYETGAIMQTAQHKNLIRKQFLVSESNVIKLEKIARSSGTSATEIVRRAIDAFDPESLHNQGESDLIDLVSIRLQEAIADTRATRKKLDKSLKDLEAR